MIFATCMFSLCWGLTHRVRWDVSSIRESVYKHCYGFCSRSVTLVFTLGALHDEQSLGLHNVRHYGWYQHCWTTNATNNATTNATINANVATIWLDPNTYTSANSSPACSISWWCVCWIYNWGDDLQMLPWVCLQDVCLVECIYHSVTLSWFY